MENQMQNSIPANHKMMNSKGQSNLIVEEAGELPIEIEIELRVHAQDRITGARIELGEFLGGEWTPLRYREQPRLISNREELELWLTDPHSLEAYEGRPSLYCTRSCVCETVQRCLSRVHEMLKGARPVDRAVEVWPVNGQVWRVEPGERIPPGVTHIRPVDPVGVSEWAEMSELLRRSDGAPRATETAETPFATSS